MTGLVVIVLLGTLMVRALSWLDEQSGIVAVAGTLLSLVLATVGWTWASLKVFPHPPDSRCDGRAARCVARRLRDRGHAVVHDHLREPVVRAQVGDVWRGRRVARPPFVGLRAGPNHHRLRGAERGFLATQAAHEAELGTAGRVADGRTGRERPTPAARTSARVGAGAAEPERTAGTACARGGATRSSSRQRVPFGQAWLNERSSSRPGDQRPQVPSALRRVRSVHESTAGSAIRRVVCTTPPS